MTLTAITITESTPVLDAEVTAFAALIDKQLSTNISLDIAGKNYADALHALAGKLGKEPSYGKSGTKVEAKISDTYLGTRERITKFSGYGATNDEAAKDYFETATSFFTLHTPKYPNSDYGFAVISRRTQRCNAFSPAYGQSSPRTNGGDDRIGRAD